MRSVAEYGGELIRSALNGALSAGEEILQEESPRGVLSRSARSALAPSLAAASVGLLAGYVVTRRKPPGKAVAFCLLGGALGFVGSMAWNTRHVTAGMAHGAMKELSATRDAHWLSKHPIDYA